MLGGGAPEVVVYREPMLRRLGRPLAATLALAALGTGCSRSPSYAVVVERATLVSADVDPRAACGDERSPRVFVTVRGPHAEARTSLAPSSAAPAWDEAILAGRASTLGAGLQVEVLGVCESESAAPFLLGATTVLPTPRNFQGYPIVLERFGAIQRLTLHLERGAPTAVTSGDCDRLGCYDAGGGYDEGGYWDSVEGGSYDDGSYDDGSSDDGSSDDGSGDW